MANITALKTRLGSKVQAIQEPETSLAVRSGYLALSNNSMDIIRANLKHQPLSCQLFDTVKSPSGGSTVFSVPGLSGDEAEKELTGIILDYSTPRAYWNTADPVAGTPPVCSSLDSVVSLDGKACSQCPYSTFSSKDGKSFAKACKESVLLYFLRPDHILPLMIRVPVSSKMRFLKYATRLISTLTPINGIVTKITLERATSREGKPYALFRFEVDSVLPAEEAKQAGLFARQFMELINKTGAEAKLSEAC